MQGTIYTPDWAGKGRHVDPTRPVDAPSYGDDRLRRWERELLDPDSPPLHQSHRKPGEPSGNIPTVPRTYYRDVWAGDPDTDRYWSNPPYTPNYWR